MHCGTNDGTDYDESLKSNGKHCSECVEEFVLMQKRGLRIDSALKTKQRVVMAGGNDFGLTMMIVMLTVFTY